MDFSLNQIYDIYGESFLSMEKKLVKSTLIWKKRPTSKVFFILEKDEFQNKDRTDFLKKILTAANFTLEISGFGIMVGEPSLEKLGEMPGNLGFVFSDGFNEQKHNSKIMGEKTMFFSSKLGDLESDRESKMKLWNFIKENSIIQ